MRNGHSTLHVAASVDVGTSEERKMKDNIVECNKKCIIIIKYNKNIRQQAARRHKYLLRIWQGPRTLAIDKQQ